MRLAFSCGLDWFKIESFFTKKKNNMNCFINELNINFSYSNDFNIVFDFVTISLKKENKGKKQVNYFKKFFNNSSLQECLIKQVNYNKLNSILENEKSHK